MFGDLPVWKNVPESERRDIYVDCAHNLAKKEKELAKTLRKKNTRRLADILDRMTAIKYNTTWEQVKLLPVPIRRAQSCFCFRLSGPADAPGQPRFRR